MLNRLMSTDAMKSRLTARLRRLLDMMPVRGSADDRSAAGEIPYHIVVGGSAVLGDRLDMPGGRF
jgi:hypothetical protein